MDDNNLIMEILVKHSLRIRLSKEETRILERWRAQSDGHRILLEKFRNSRWVAEQRRQLHAAPTAEMWEVIRQHIDQEGEPAPVHILPVRRRPGWFTGAAAAACGLLLAGAGWFFWEGKRNPEVRSTAQAYKPVQTRPPAKFTNLLQCGDGSHVLLDTVRMRAVAVEEGGYRLRKTDSFTYRYERAPEQKKATVRQQFFTGAQARALVFWENGDSIALNGASSLQYAVNMADDAGYIAVKGEAYFHIRGDPGRPVTVRFGAGHSLQVLGTAFDVRAYGSEADSWVTLVSGAVKVRNGNKIAPLKKNQQARLGGRDLEVTTMTDLSPALAWIRSGRAKRFFDFDHTDLPTALREVASYYGVAVHNPDNLKGTVFTGQVLRTQSLEVTLEALEQAQNDAFRLRRRRDTILVTAGGSTQK